MTDHLSMAGFSGLQVTRYGDASKPSVWPSDLKSSREYAGGDRHVDLVGFWQSGSRVNDGRRSQLVLEAQGNECSSVSIGPTLCIEPQVRHRSDSFENDFRATLDEIGRAHV